MPVSCSRRLSSWKLNLMCGIDNTIISLALVHGRCCRRRVHSCSYSCPCPGFKYRFPVSCRMQFYAIASTFAMCLLKYMFNLKIKISHRTSKEVRWTLSSVRGSKPEQKGRYYKRSKRKKMNFENMKIVKRIPRWELNFMGERKKITGWKRIKAEGSSHSLSLAILNGMFHSPFKLIILHNSKS